MEPPVDLIPTILFLGTAQGVLLALVLLTSRRGNRIANRILAITLILFSIDIVLHTFPHSEYPYSHPHHAEIVLILFLLISPLIYLYVKALTESAFRFTPGVWLHFVPFAVCALLFIAFQSEHDPTTDLTRESAHMSPFGLTMAFAIVLQAMAYVAASLKTLHRHARIIRDSFSSIEKINLNWLRFLILAYAGNWLFILVGFSLGGHGGASRTGEYLTVLLAVLIYAIGYMALRQPEIFSGGQESETDEAGKKKYEKSTLNPDRAEAYLKKLQQAIETDKPYLDNDLTLAGLADRLSISTHHLSQIINERLGQNFFEFVNLLRVEEAKRMLASGEHQHLNISAIGFEAGFNSVSAFNTAFKKYTSLTPSQYRISDLDSENSPKA